MTFKEALINLVMEESAEVIHRASKMKRFGPDDINPARAVPCRELLREEINDLLVVIEMLEDEGLIDRLTPQAWEAHRLVKRGRIDEFMRYSWGRGLLEDYRNGKI